MTVQSRVIIDGDRAWSRVESRLFPYTAIGRLFARDLGTVCTGSIVAENVVLTAAHCVAKASPGDGGSEKPLIKSSQVVFVANKIKGRPSRKFVADGVHLVTAPGKGFLVDKSKDWAFVTFREPLGLRYGWFRLGQGPPVNEQLGIAVQVPGYALEPKCNTGRSLCESRGRLVSRSRLEGAHSANTAAGSSGAPILNLDPNTKQYALLGVHTGGDASAKTNFAVLSSGFAEKLASVKRDSYAVYGQPAGRHIGGIVCHAHDECDDFTFCAAANNGTCFRCDACKNFSPGQSAPFGPTDGSCPAKCMVVSAPDSMALAALDFDDDGSDACEILSGDSPALSALDSNIRAQNWACQDRICLTRAGCGIVSELPEDPDLAASYLEFGSGAYIPQNLADAITPSRDELDSFGMLAGPNESPAGVFARARGYATGALVDNSVVLAFGTVRRNGRITRIDSSDPHLVEEATSATAGGVAVLLIAMMAALLSLIAAILRKKA